jgi:thioredoxin-related protein
MKYLLFLLVFPFLLTAQTENAIEDFSNWHTDYDTAMAHAKKSKKNILVYFTGSDWCAPCKMLKKDLFAKDEFKNVSESYALLYIDIPRNKDLLSSDQMNHNSKVLSKLNKRGVFPLFKVLTAQEKELDEYSGYSMNGEISYHLEFLNRNK